MLPRSPFFRGLLLLAALATAAAIPPSADLTISGRVVDASSGRALESAQVFVEGSVYGALTDRSGRYSLRLPESWASRAEFSLRVELIGYTASTVTVRPATFADRGAVVVDVRLTSTALRLQEMTVTGAAADAARGRSERAASIAVAQPRSINLPAPAMSPGERLLGPRHDREQYAHIDENDFHAARDTPLSTFSADVDRASYSNIRRFLLREGRVPPVDAVQIEEMVNYFPYRYDRPRGDAPVAVTTELGAAPWREGHQLLRIGIAAEPVETEDLPPANLVFLIDVSGSMRSPDKLGLVKQSLRMLVAQLREEDRVSMVVYAGAAGLVLEPTSGADRDRILAALDGLEAGGSTAGGAGLRLAYDVARRNFVRGGNNRVILATDGDFNVGESSDAAMTRLVEERREEGTFLTVLGFGTGNLQNTKMQEMAQHGNGNYAYIDGMLEARKVLVGEMGGTLLTVAKDVKIQVEFNPARVRSYRLLGYENRLLADRDFNDDTKDAGEIGAGHTVTALYEIVPVGSDSEVDGGSVDPLRYGGDATAPRGGDSDELAFVKIRWKAPEGTESRLLTTPVRAQPVDEASADFHFASAVAGFGMLLRESEHRGSITGYRVLELARAGLGWDPGGYRAEFMTLVRSWIDRGVEIGTGG